MERRLLAVGGRVTSIVSGYRCQCVIGTDGWNDATFRFDAPEKLSPGESCAAVLLPHRPEFWSSVVAGDMIELAEGQRVVGSATVTVVERGDGAPHEE